MPRATCSVVMFVLVTAPAAGQEVCEIPGYRGSHPVRQVALQAPNFHRR